MKILGGHIVLLVVIFYLLSCGSPIKKEEKPSICVSILPQKYFIEKIAKDNFNIEVIIPDGLSPTVYEPSPQQIIALNKAQFYFKVGNLPFENSWMGRIYSLNPSIKIFDTSKGINGIEETDHNHRHINPHIWLSPKLVMKMSENMKNILIKIQPKQKDFFEENYKKFLASIRNLDTNLTQKFLELKNKKFIILHPFLSYFAKDYGLIQISYEVEGKETTLVTIRDIIDLSKKENIKLVLIPMQLSDSYLNVISKEFDGNTVIFNPLEYNWMENMNRLLDIFSAKN